MFGVCVYHQQYQQQLMRAASSLHLVIDAKDTFSPFRMQHKPEAVMSLWVCGRKRFSLHHVPRLRGMAPHILRRHFHVALQTAFMQMLIFKIIYFLSSGNERFPDAVDINFQTNSIPHINPTVRMSPSEIKIE